MRKKYSVTTTRTIVNIYFIECIFNNIRERPTIYCVVASMRQLVSVALAIGIGYILSS